MNRQELGSMVRMHQAEIYRYLRFLGVVDPATAEDLTQETFLAAFKSESTPPLEDVRRRAGWLRGIARNLFLAHCRRMRSNPVQFNSAHVDRAEQVWNEHLLRGGDGFDYVETLRNCLKRLDQRQRSALQMRYQHQLPRPVMAERLGMGVEGVKGLLRRLRAALKNCVEQQLGLHAEGREAVTVIDSEQLQS